MVNENEQPALARPKKEKVNFIGQVRKEGAWKRIKFLSDFMNAAGINSTQIAKAMDITRPTVTNWFRVDDISLSMARRIIETFGYTVEFFLTRESEEVAGSGDNKTTANFIYKKRENEREPTLCFLTVALARYDLSKSGIARGMGLSVSAVLRWFQHDDMMLSRLFELMNIYNLSLRVKIKKEILEEKRGVDDSRTKDLIKSRLKKGEKVDVPASRRYYSVQLQTKTSIEF